MPPPGVIRQLRTTSLICIRVKETAVFRVAKCETLHFPNPKAMSTKNKPETCWITLQP